MTGVQTCALPIYVAACDQRYANIASTLADLKQESADIMKLIRQVGGGLIIALLTFALTHTVFK